MKLEIWSLPERMNSYKGFLNNLIRDLKERPHYFSGFKLRTGADIRMRLLL